MLLPCPEQMKDVPPELLKDMPDMTKMPIFQDFFERCPGKDPADGIMLQVLFADFVMHVTDKGLSNSW